MTRRTHLHASLSRWLHRRGPAQACRWWPRRARTAQQLSLDTYYRSPRGWRVRAAVMRWSKCMMARGSKYASPLDPPRDPRFRNALTPLEIETAKADVASKNQTHLVGTWFAVESTYQNREVVNIARRSSRSTWPTHVRFAAPPGSSVDLGDMGPVEWCRRVLQDRARGRWSRCAAGPNRAARVAALVLMRW
jgi:hypothetical protein